MTTCLFNKTEETAGHGDHARERAATEAHRARQDAMKLGLRHVSATCKTPT